MTAPLVIANARIVDPATNTDRKGAVLVQDGRIDGIAEGAPQGVPEGATLIDAKGLVLAPGLIDMRVFTGEPGHEYRETLATAGHAAAAGGVTTFVLMPNTTPVVDDGAIVVRSPQGTVITGTGNGAVVCYEADDMDPVRRTGWSVVVTGLAHLVSDPAAAARYSRQLPSWAPGVAGDLVAIEPGLVTGRRVT